MRIVHTIYIYILRLHSNKTIEISCDGIMYRQDTIISILTLNPMPSSKIPRTSIYKYTKHVWLFFCVCLHAHRSRLNVKDIKNNAWISRNNEFLVTSEVIYKLFSWVTKSRVRIIGKLHHEWSKIVIHGNEIIILFLTRHFMSLNTQFR